MALTVSNQAKAFGGGAQTEREGTQEKLDNAVIIPASGWQRGMRERVDEVATTRWQ